MGWQTLALIGGGVIVLITLGTLAIVLFRKEARKLGGSEQENETLQEIFKRDEARHRLDGGPLPLSQREQLKRLRDLLKKADRRRP